MKTLITKLSLIALPLAGHPVTTGSSTSRGYVIGGIIAFFILGYLVYTLMKPEKF
ncbi:MAG TPA: K(+)-transporting ATPase subunit F [Bacteroidales bacterium]|nr:K(+)-transporting ATPase subunit F [Bacteroidales bacterium]